MRYIKLLRVSHYIKNLLIFLPLLFSGTLLSNRDGFISCVIALVCFCMVSSAIYVFNDIQDKDVDKNHPRKSQRPIASGAVSVRAAIIMIAVLLILCGVISALFLPPASNLFLIVYLAINILYSIYLKHIPILDISCVASGFLIRLMYGAFVTGIVISNWLYLTVIVTSAYMALGKRRNELITKGENSSRKVLDKYSIGFLDKSMTMMLTSTIMCYALWCLDSETIARYGTNRLIWTVPLVIMITLKYNLDIEKKDDGDPVEILTHDVFLILLVLVYVCVMAGLLYFF